MIRLPLWVRQSRVRRAGVSIVPEDLEFKRLKALADVRFDVMKREDRGTQLRRELLSSSSARDSVGGMSDLDALARGHGIDPEAPDALVKTLALMCDLRDLVGVLTVSAVLPPEVLADAASLSAAGVGFPLARAAIAEGRRQRAASGLFDGPTQDQVVLYVDDPSEELVGVGVEGRADASDDEVPQGQGDDQLARDRDAADVVVGVARSTHESSPSVGRSRVAARSVVGAPGAVAPGAGVPTVEDPADTLLSSPSVGGSAGPVGGDGLGLSSPTGDLGAGAGS